MLYDLEKLRVQVQQRLTPRRYAHSIAVQKQAVYLAKQYGADWYKAGVAGLVHDVCKDMDQDAQLNYLRSCGILLDVLTQDHPPVWHAIAGAEYAHRVMGIDDDEICGAIRYHTTGRRAMTLLEKVIYIADLTSEDRNYPDVGRVRKLATQSLDDAVWYCQRYIMGKLVLAGEPIMQEAWEAYNYYLSACDAAVKEPKE